MADSDLDFSTVLVSAIHDMKNSLFMLTQSTETLASQAKLEQRDDSEQIGRLHYEVSRLNGSLMQVLAMYRMKHANMPIMIEEVFVAEFLEDLIDKNVTYTQQTEVELTLEADPDLAWYFDESLVSFMLNDIIVNAIRYTHSKIKISAHLVDNKLCLQVEDDGQGYPQNILDFSNGAQPATADFVKFRSGLGMYLARVIAKAHTNKLIEGDIELSNDGALGGSVFRVYLP
ncbi:sensor histidine kinase [Alginatibacterium sediminis]|uniref:Sensor histidine kinase n=1 Tax=Alginatibacterium sediminis TaxID=2164068 RepID=A0A420EI42_9ALTE|nr:HAMP domain-containing sensor histidine kinase [Alginatibacterium sediminis]RKF20226.1 sensor histidine kinase [Alginatibacterium sediminis]